MGYLSGRESLQRKRSFRFATVCFIGSMLLGIEL